jgi:ubiquitin carboxyl-terminal hydrolase 26/29/37
MNFFQISLAGNGRRQVLAAMSGKKSTPARTPSGAPLPPRRLAPVEATYSSPKKRKRPADMDDVFASEGLTVRPQQKARNNVATPSSIANAARQAHAAAQVSLPARSTPLNTALPRETQARTTQGNGTITPFKAKPQYRSKTYSSYWSNYHQRGSAPSNAPAGLVNLGNTCYLNAVLQSLFSLPTFPGAINAAVAMGGEALPANGVLHALGNCLAERKASSAAGRAAFSPEQVKLAVGRRLGTFRGSFQQDAHEFFCGLLEAVQTEVLAVEASRQGRKQLRASETTDPSTRVFGFAVEHEIICTACKKVSYVTEQCSHLSLDLPKHVNTTATIVPPGLDSMLSSYFQEENVDKGCEGCGAECINHTVRHRIKRLPQILALHVKRFQVTFQQSTGTVTCAKVRDQISISKVLRLKPYCVEENLTMPLPPLNATTHQPQQKENVELNNNGQAPLPSSSPPALEQQRQKQQSSIPPLEPAILSDTFYSGSGNAGANAFDRLFSPQSVTTFSRKNQQKQKQQPAQGAARTSYWDKPTSRSIVRWAEKASNIINASGIQQRHRRNYEDEEEAELLAAIEASKKDQHADSGKATPYVYDDRALRGIGEKDAEDEEEMDADLATALKRSLEEQQNQVEYYYKQQQQSERENIDLGEALTPVRDTVNGVDDNEYQQDEDAAAKVIEETALENVETLSIGIAAAAQKAPPSSPIPEIIEDDAKIEYQADDLSTKEALPPLEYYPRTKTDAAAKHTLATYHLAAIINHHGPSAESGHFTAVTHNSTTGQWFRFNDAQVHRIQGDAATNEMAERDGYMLFYAVMTT